MTPSDHGPREIELKLDVAAEDAALLRSSVLPRLAGEGTSARLKSVYYDTDARDLRAAGVTLRVRADGEIRCQTVKLARGPGIGLFDRDEWESPLETAQIDMEALRQTPAAERLDLSGLHLRPVFETRITRMCWQVGSADSIIEVALDSGRVVAGRRSEALTELELELKRGAPEDLFRFVHEIEGDVGLRLGVRAKSERGYRLADGKRSRPVKAEPVRVTAAMPAAAAFQAIAMAALRHFGLNDVLLTERRAPEALHQSRVALRRLRSALSLFKTMIDDDALPLLKAELRDVSQALGEARNLDVYLARVDQPGAEPRSADAAVFMQDLEARRSRAYDGVVERLRSAGFRRLLLRLVEWLHTGAWLIDGDPRRVARRNRPAREAAAAMLDRQRRKVKRRGRRLKALDPAARHRVRIEAKKLRYAAEFFAALADTEKAARRHAAFLAALENLQDHLGDLNDIETGRELTGGLSPTAPAIAGTAAAMPWEAPRDADVGALLRSAAAAHATLCDARKFWSDWD